MNPVSFVIYGRCQSKANSRRWTGRRMIKSAAAMAFIRDGSWQIPQLPRLLEGDLWVDIVIYYPTRRNDLDESLVLDMMQSRIYSNDRQVKDKRVRHGVDAKSPRVIVTVGELSTSV